MVIFHSYLSFPEGHQSSASARCPKRSASGVPRSRNSRRPWQPPRRRGHGHIQQKYIFEKKEMKNVWCDITMYYLWYSIKFMIFYVFMYIYIYVSIQNYWHCFKIICQHLIFDDIWCDLCDVCFDSMGAQDADDHEAKQRREEQRHEMRLQMVAEHQVQMVKCYSCYAKSWNHQDDVMGFMSQDPDFLWYFMAEICMLCCKIRKSAVWVAKNVLNGSPSQRQNVT